MRDYAIIRNYLLLLMDDNRIRCVLAVVSPQFLKISGGGEREYGVLVVHPLFVKESPALGGLLCLHRCVGHGLVRLHLADR